MDRSAQVLERLKGPVVPLNICFNEDGTVHYEAVEKYVDWHCEQGPVVLLLTAGSREFAYLSEKEIYELTALVGRVNQGRSLYIASTGLWKPSLTRISSPMPTAPVPMRSRCRSAPGCPRPER